MFWVFNEKYSINAVYKQTQRQQKSVGSFLLRIEPFYMKTSADSSIFFNEIQIDFYEAISTKTEFVFYTALLEVGYTYNFVFAKKFFIAPFIFAGTGVQYFDFEGVDNKIGNFYQTYGFNTRISVGYNGDIFMSGIVLDYETKYTTIAIAKFSTNSLLVRFMIGIRFWKETKKE